MLSTQLRHGAELLDDGATRFSLWAPDAHDITVDLGDGRHYPLTAQNNGWFTATLHCGAGQPYRFLVDGRPLPDPASRCQDGNVHDASIVTDSRAYRWRNDDWRGRPWHETVIYEVHVGLYGGFAALEGHLPQLRDLGITAIELMPLGAFPGNRNWGYDGVLPFAPHTNYGSPAQLKSLIDRAHGLGLMVFVDVVYNHFGPEGNYLGEYASRFFRDDLQTPWGPAIDFRRREVRNFFCENALMWVQDYRVDGLRLDAVHAISERSFLVELAARVRAVARDRHLHLMLENEHNDAGLLSEGYTAQWNDDAHNALHVLLTGETEGYYADFAEAPIWQLARCLAEGFAFQGETDRHGNMRGYPSKHLPPTAFVMFLQNHDQVGNRALGERLIALTERDALIAATALLLLSPMVPLLFMGEERGVREPFLYFTDHPPGLAAAVRDGRRSEFAAFAQFANASLREQIPDPNAAATFERSRPAPPPDEAAWLALYRRLLQLRHEHIVPRLEGAQSLGARVLSDAALSASWRLGDGSRLRIDLNLGATSLAELPRSQRAETLFSAGGAGRQMAPRSVIATLEPPP